MSKDKLNYYTYNLDMKILNILAIILFIIIIFLMIILKIDFSGITKYNMGFLIITLIIWLIFHEILHGIGFSLFKSVNKKNIVFGMSLEKGVFYCMCKEKISRKIIFTSLLFPVTIIGIITLIVGILFSNDLLIYLSISNIIGSIGDIIMSIYFYKCPKDIIYLDLDDCTSFTVLSKKDLSNISVPGIKLISNGIYNNQMIAKDKRRLVISKSSWIILIIIFILILIYIIGGVL